MRRLKWFLAAYLATGLICSTYIVASGGYKGEALPQALLHTAALIMTSPVLVLNLLIVDVFSLWLGHACS